jgi:hypothetical protein
MERRLQALGRSTPLRLTAAEHDLIFAELTAALAGCPRVFVRNAGAAYSEADHAIAAAVEHECIRNKILGEGQWGDLPWVDFVWSNDADHPFNTNALYMLRWQRPLRVGDDDDIVTVATTALGSHASPTLEFIRCPRVLRPELMVAHAASGTDSPDLTVLTPATIRRLLPSLIEKHDPAHSHLPPSDACVDHVITIIRDLHGEEGKLPAPYPSKMKERMEALRFCVDVERRRMLALPLSAPLLPRPSTLPLSLMERVQQIVQGAGLPAAVVDRIRHFFANPRPILTGRDHGRRRSVWVRRRRQQKKNRDGGGERAEMRDDESEDDERMATPPPAAAATAAAPRGGGGAGGGEGEERPRPAGPPRREEKRPISVLEAERLRREPPQRFSLLHTPIPIGDVLRESLKKAEWGVRTKSEKKEEGKKKEEKKKTPTTDKEKRRAESNKQQQHLHWDGTIKPSSLAPHMWSCKTIDTTIAAGVGTPSLADPPPELVQQLASAEDIEETLYGDDADPVVTGQYENYARMVILQVGRGEGRGEGVSVTLAAGAACLASSLLPFASQTYILRKRVMSLSLSRCVSRCLPVCLRVCVSLSLSACGSVYCC